MIESIGERIKNRRKMFGLSVDELADIIGKNRATIYRYESNEIENMSITILEPLAKALHTTPAELCGWNNTDLTPGEYALLSDFRKLNPAGQQFAAATVKGITQMPQYKNDPAPAVKEEAAESSA